MVVFLSYKGYLNVLNVSDKVKIIGLLKGNTSSVEVGSVRGRINQASTVFKTKNMK
jgi:hypothetical protein